MSHCATIKDHEEKNDDIMQELVSWKDTAAELSKIVFKRDQRISELSDRIDILEMRLNGDRVFEGSLMAGVLSCTRKLHMSLSDNGDIYCKYCGRNIDDSLDETLEVNNVN